MDLSKYLEAMKNLPARFSNLTFWRECRKLKDSVVNALEYLNDWGIGIENGLNNKLPKSPSDWEAWTEDEQGTARAKIDAEKALGAWEDIATATIEEPVSSITVDMDDNGNPLSLSHVVLECIIPQEKASTRRSISFANSKIPSAENSFSNSVADTRTNHPTVVSTCAHILSERILCEGSIVTRFDNPFSREAVYAVRNGYCEIIAESFDSICAFTHDDAFPVGTKLIVRGIRK